MVNLDNMDILFEKQLKKLFYKYEADSFQVTWDDLLEWVDKLRFEGCKTRMYIYTPNTYVIVKTTSLGKMGVIVANDEVLSYD